MNAVLAIDHGIAYVLIGSPPLSYVLRMPFASSIPQTIDASGSEATIVSCTRSSSLIVRLAPLFEPLAQVAQEAARERAVDQPVVVRERQVHDRPDRDRVGAVVVADHPRPLDDGVGAEDRGLW